MSNQNEESYPHEIKLDISEGVDWADALGEFEEDPKPAAEAPKSEPAPAPKPEANAEPAPAAPAETERPLSRYEELCKKPSLTMGKEDLTVFTELSDMLCSVNEALEDFRKLTKNHPELLRPNVVKTCEANMKDTASVMFKEFHALRNGRMNKTYDPRCVCKQCHTVYLVPLPGDGLCDECKAAATPRQEP